RRRDRGAVPGTDRRVARGGGAPTRGPGPGPGAHPRQRSPLRPRRVPRVAGPLRRAGLRPPPRARLPPCPAAVKRLPSPTLLVTAGLAVLALAMRLPFRMQTLYAYDSANYAYALRDYYNVAHHHPHPPGYPLYVAA